MTYKYQIVFDRINQLWWHKFIGGYNHCFVRTHLDFPDPIVLEPHVHMLDIGYWDAVQYAHDKTRGYGDKIPPKIDVLEIFVRPTFKNRLIGIKPTTCATQVQYICGFDTGAITVSRLYKILTTRNAAYLRKKGILGVKRWEVSREALVSLDAE